MKLLLHMCCGPCSTYPYKILKDKGYDIEGLFYNPNIHPIEEHNKRSENVKIFAEKNAMKVHYDNDFMQDVWEKMTDKEKRCNYCYSIRMQKAAKFASENGFDGFTTTLLVSPYQNTDLIKKLGELFADKYNVTFVYEDFRPGFREGQQMARDLGLYRQKYCGCILSLHEI